MADQQEHISSIKWNIYGKITDIEQSQANGSPGSTSSIQYQYDPSGNRIAKIVSTQAAGASGPTTNTTWYVRDAQGNVLGVYTYNQGGSPPPSGNGLTWSEQHFYGSSRLGMLKPGFPMPAGISDANVSGGDQVEFAGNHIYEITNHLGNVLATISDLKVGLFVQSGSGFVFDHYQATVLSAQDYYPFGMPMPGRTFNGVTYRYGFNGKEQDNEVKGIGNQIDYGMRVYDPRLGRFLSVDPLTKKYPWNSNYAYAENDVIRSIDLDGLERLSATIDKPAPWDIRSLELSTPSSSQNKQPTVKRQTEISVKNVIFTKQLMCHPDNTYLVKDRERIAAEYAKLDHAHGQVDVPQSRFWSSLEGERTLGVDATINGHQYSAMTVIDDNGYLANRLAPITGTPPPIGLGGGGLGTFRSFTAAEAGLFISTEEGAQSLEKVESIKKSIQAGDLSIWAQPIRAVEHEGQMYILNGHNRLKAFSELGSDAKVSVQVLSSEEAGKLYKDVMEFIKKGGFKTPIKSN